MESLINASWISIRASDDACFIYSAIFVRLRFEWQRSIITIRKVTIALYAKKSLPPPGFCPGDVSFFVSSLKTPFYPFSPMPRCLKKQTTNRKSPTRFANVWKASVREYSKSSGNNDTACSKWPRKNTPLVVCYLTHRMKREEIKEITCTLSDKHTVLSTSRMVIEEKRSASLSKCPLT